MHSIAPTLVGVGLKTSLVLQLRNSSLKHLPTHVHTHAHIHSHDQDGNHVPQSIPLMLPLLMFLSERANSLNHMPGHTFSSLSQFMQTGDFLAHLYLNVSLPVVFLHAS